MPCISDEKKSSKFGILNDTLIISQLKSIFRQHFPICNRVRVTGILSYSIDDDSEKFLKVDIDSEYASSENTFDVAGKPEQTDYSDNRPLASISPPLLPPLVLHSSRNSQSYNNCEKRLCTQISVGILDKPQYEKEDSIVDQDSTPEEEHCPITSRRDRRKCRQPKRQLVSETGKKYEDTESEADAFTEDGCEERGRADDKDIIDLHNTLSSPKVAKLDHSPSESWDQTSSANQLLQLTSVSSATSAAPSAVVNSPSCPQLVATTVSLPLTSKTQSFPSPLLAKLAIATRGVISNQVDCSTQQSFSSPSGKIQLGETFRQNLGSLQSEAHNISSVGSSG
ncbi:unnamed protein product, partial [Protopolystoma xenopodis]